jgi:UPF0755 protein
MRFDRLARDPALVETLGLEGPSLEGYLFPDTYYFPNQTPALAIIQKMVQTFREQFSDEWHQRAADAQFVDPRTHYVGIDY